MFRGLGFVCIRAEWDYYRLVYNLDAFQSIWGIAGAFCRHIEEELFI